MTLDNAKLLKIGQLVACPPDRGEPGFIGRVEHVGTQVSLAPKPFVWVTVRPVEPNSHASVWPSHRIA